MTFSMFLWYLRLAATPVALLMVSVALGVLSRKIRSACLLASSLAFAIACAGWTATAFAPIHMRLSGKLSPEQEAANELSWQILAVAEPLIACSLVAGALLLIVFAVRYRPSRAQG